MNDPPRVRDEVDSTVAHDTSPTRMLLDLQTGIPRPVVVPPREVVSAVVRLEFPMDSVRGRTGNMSLVTGT